MSAVITEFMTSYRREVNFYRDAARMCADQCEALLRQNGIRAFVTSRAKRLDSLETKLKNRNRDKHYKSSDDIRADLVDLAGVRVALYFPKDRSRVKQIFSEYFAVKRIRDFPLASAQDDSGSQDNSKQSTSDQPGEYYIKRFSGYHATHFLVQLNAEDLPETEHHLLEADIEIQVASVLMHAWSEVEHDLVYKPQSGSLSKSEYAILDEVNGLVISGEIALERLQEAGEERVRQKGRRFDNQYELASFLYETARTAQPNGPEPRMGRMDVLLSLLRRAGLDRPEELRTFFGNPDTGDNAPPIANQVIDKIEHEFGEQYVEWMSDISRNEFTEARAILLRSNEQPTLILLTIMAELLVERGIDPSNPQTEEIGIQPELIKHLINVRKDLQQGKKMQNDRENVRRLAQHVIRTLRLTPRK